MLKTRLKTSISLQKPSKLLMTLKFMPPQLNSKSRERRRCTKKKRDLKILETGVFLQDKSQKRNYSIDSPNSGLTSWKTKGSACPDLIGFKMVRGAPGWRLGHGWNLQKVWILKDFGGLVKAPLQGLISKGLALAHLKDWGEKKCERNCSPQLCKHQPRPKGVWPIQVRFAKGASLKSNCPKPSIAMLPPTTLMGRYNS